MSTAAHEHYRALAKTYEIPEDEVPSILDGKRRFLGSESLRVAVQRPGVNDLQVDNAFEGHLKDIIDMLVEVRLKQNEGHRPQEVLAQCNTIVHRHDDRRGFPNGSLGPFTIEAITTAQIVSPQITRGLNIGRGNPEIIVVTTAEQRLGMSQKVRGVVVCMHALRMVNRCGGYGYPTLSTERLSSGQGKNS